jgi:hypothetical protein
MSGKMQENSDNAERLSSEETRAGGMTTPVLWRAEASLWMERMESALLTASKEADNLLREVSYRSHNPRFDSERDIPDVETNDWRAVCGKTARTVRREGRRKPSLPLSWSNASNSKDFPASLRRVCTYVDNLVMYS